MTTLNKPWSIFVINNNSDRPLTQYEPAIRWLAEDDAINQATEWINDPSSANCSIYIKNEITYDFLDTNGKRTPIGKDWANPESEDTKTLTIALTESKWTGALNLYHTFDDSESSEEQLAQRGSHLYSDSDLIITHHKVSSLKADTEAVPENNDETVWVIIDSDLNPPVSFTLYGFFKSKLDAYEHAQFLMEKLYYHGDMDSFYIIPVQAY